MEINYALIGKRIRETRKQRGLSAEELAEIADLSTVYISYIENAKRKPSLESLIKISRNRSAHWSSRARWPAKSPRSPAPDASCSSRP